MTTKNVNTRILHAFEREALSRRRNRVFYNRDTARPAYFHQIHTNTCQYNLRDRKFTLVLRRRHSSHFKHPFDPNLLFPFVIVLLLAAYFIAGDTFWCCEENRALQHGRDETYGACLNCADD